MRSWTDPKHVRDTWERGGKDTERRKETKHQPRSSSQRNTRAWIHPFGPVETVRNMAYDGSKGQDMQQGKQGNRTNTHQNDKKRGHENHAESTVGNGTTHIPSKHVAHTIHSALQDGASVLEEQTHANVLNALQAADARSNLETKRKVEAKDNNQDLHKLNSLEVPLGQALQARDAVLLERLLSTASIPVIQRTVERLDSLSIQLLVKAILDSVESSPSRAEKVATWLSSIMKSHMAYMMSAPEVQKEIMRLNQLAEERLRTYQGLQGLSGRLNLAIGK